MSTNRETGTAHANTHAVTIRRHTDACTLTRARSLASRARIRVPRVPACMRGRGRWTKNHQGGCR